MNGDPRVSIRFNKYCMTFVRGFNGRKFHFMDPKHSFTENSMAMVAKHLRVTVEEIAEVFECIKEFLYEKK
jgi:hypothetical protein